MHYTRHRSRLRKKRSDGKTSQSELEGIVLAETVAYVIEDDSDGPFYTKDLAELYKTRLKQARRQGGSFGLHCYSIEPGWSDN